MPFVGLYNPASRYRRRHLRLQIVTTSAQAGSSPACRLYNVNFIYEVEIMYIVRLSFPETGNITYHEFDDKQKAKDFAIMAVARGWVWDIYKLTKD